MLASSTSLGVGLRIILFCFPLLELLATAAARGCGLDARTALLASGVEAMLCGRVRLLTPPDMKLRNFCFSTASHFSCLRLKASSLVSSSSSRLSSIEAVWLVGGASVISTTDFVWWVLSSLVTFATCSRSLESSLSSLFASLVS